MAARGDDDEVGFRRDALSNRIVGRRVAGMQGDQDVGAGAVKAVDRALGEMQFFKTGIIVF